MYLCICVQCGWYRGWHFDDSWDGTHLQPPVKLYSSEHSEFHCNEDDAKNANNDVLMMILWFKHKKHNILPPWLPTSCYLFLTMALHQKISIPICPDFANICRILYVLRKWLTWSGKKQKEWKAEEVVRSHFSNQIKSNLDIVSHFDYLYIYLYIYFEHWCYFLLLSLRHYLANQFPKITRYLLKGLIQQHDPRTLSLSLSSSLSSSLSWFSTRIPGLCLCPNRFQESGNILRSQILQKNFFF